MGASWRGEAPKLSLERILNATIFQEFRSTRCWSGAIKNAVSFPPRATLKASRSRFHSKWLRSVSLWRLKICHAPLKVPNAPGQAPQQPQIKTQAPEKHSNKSTMAWLLKHYAGLVGVARAAEKVMAV